MVWITGGGAWRCSGCRMRRVRDPGAPLLEKGTYPRETRRVEGTHLLRLKLKHAPSRCEPTDRRRSARPLLNCAASFNQDSERVGQISTRLYVNGLQSTGSCSLNVFNLEAANSDERSFQKGNKQASKKLGQPNLMTREQHQVGVELGVEPTTYTG
jgi:hypothetical protein